MTLQTGLDTLRASWEVRVGDRIAGLFAGDIDALRGAGNCAQSAPRASVVSALARRRIEHFPIKWTPVDREKCVGNPDRQT